MMIDVSSLDLLGFSAAGLMLLTFAQRSMFLMRVTAIGANVCFALYGFFGELYPVLMLHLLLMPVNIKRLLEHCHGREVRRSARHTRSAPTLLDEWRLS
jgi:hypothetical protein